MTLFFEASGFSVCARPLLALKKPTALVLRTLGPKLEQTEVTNVKIVCYFSTATITITRAESGEVIITIEPP